MPGLSSLLIQKSLLGRDVLKYANPFQEVFDVINSYLLKTINFRFSHPPAEFDKRFPFSIRRG